MAAGISIPGQPATILPVLAPAGLLCLLLPAFLPLGRRFHLRWLPGLGIHVFLLCLGIVLCRLWDHRERRDWYGHLAPQSLLLKITQEPRSFPGRQPGWSTDATVLAIRQEPALNIRGSPQGNLNNWLPVSGRVRLSVTSDLKYPKGSVILVHGKLRPVRGRAAPVLFGRNIYHRLHPDVDQVRLVAAGKPSPSLTGDTRDWILAELDRHFEGVRQKSLAKALLVGYREELDDDLNAAYANTGVIHVIAISGMHLGLIYGILIMMFKPFRGNRVARIFINLLIMALLWLFTLLCGASASVTRSALMFTSLLIADCAGEDNSAPNALASSAFILLCLDPKILYDIGFQLSYAAVASLMMFNKTVGRIFKPENPLLVHTWNLLATSCAAQVLTTPLVLQHFGRFPLLFLLANLVAIPLSGIILVLLILLCVLHPLNPVTALLASLAGWLMDLMNERIMDMSALPFASIHIPWNTRDSVFAYLIIALLCHLSSRDTQRA